MEKLLNPLTIDSAPEHSKPILEQVKKAFGFIPNLMATFAHSPAVLEGYLAMDASYAKSSLTPVERQLVLLAASAQNECGYCLAAHSTILKGGLKVDAATVTAVRSGSRLNDAKYDALVRLTRQVVAERGHASEATVQQFLNAGYKPVQVMEILLGVALKTISNYLDHMNPTPIDAAFQNEK